MTTLPLAFIFSYPLLYLALSVEDLPMSTISMPSVAMAPSRIVFLLHVIMVASCISRFKEIHESLCGLLYI